MIALLHVDELTVTFGTGAHSIRALCDVTLGINEGDSVALAGVSGSGKSTLGLALLGLLPPEARVSGVVRFLGLDVLAMSPAKLSRTYLGRQATAVFQDAIGSLNPLRTVGQQLRTVIRLHSDLVKSEVDYEVHRLLAAVQLPPERVSHLMPHELSGGMAQRVAIALALACRPRLLIADEPTASLDVVTQAAIIQLLRDLNLKQGLTLLLITHDLRLAAALALRILILHHGRFIDELSQSDLLWPGPARAAETTALLEAAASLTLPLPQPSLGSPTTGQEVTD